MSTDNNNNIFLNNIPLSTTTTAAESSTLYLSGFPDDWKERELNNLFLFAKGYLGSSIKNSFNQSSMTSVTVDDCNGFNCSGNGVVTPPTSGNDSPTLADIVKGKFVSEPKGIIGFVLFLTAQDALEASKKLEDYSLDPQKPSFKIKVQFAKKNLHLNNNNNNNNIVKEERPRSKSFSFEDIDDCEFGNSTIDFIEKSSSIERKQQQQQPRLQQNLKRRFSISGSCSESLNSFLENSSCQARQTFRSMSLSIPGYEEPVSIGVPDNAIFGGNDIFSNTNAGIETNYLAFPDPIDPKFLDELETLPSLQVGGRTSCQSSPKLSASSISAETFIPSSSNNTQQNTAANNQFSAPLLVSRNGQLFSPENPPCNTLYVGNLPLYANEQEIRSLFSVAIGFKRMNFKLKNSSSPMCFVEFEDILSATKAMENMYGNLLSNSTKGGIRLSYSKNPLGVKPSSNTNVPSTAPSTVSSTSFSNCSNESNNFNITTRSYRSSSLSSLTSSPMSLSTSYPFPSYGKYSNYSSTLW